MWTANYHAAKDEAYACDRITRTAWVVLHDARINKFRVVELAEYRKTADAWTGTTIAHQTRK